MDLDHGFAGRAILFQTTIGYYIEKKENILGKQLLTNTKNVYINQSHEVHSQIGYQPWVGDIMFITMSRPSRSEVNTPKKEDLEGALPEAIML